MDSKFAFKCMCGLASNPCKEANDHKSTNAADFLNKALLDGLCLCVENGQKQAFVLSVIKMAFI